MSTLVLPKLLCISDVPVESSYHGSALIYRLLQNYPPDLIRIIQGDHYGSQPDRQLPGVHYTTLKSAYSRLRNTRIHGWYSVWLSMVSAVRAGRVKRLLGAFRAEAVLTVAHGYLLFTAVEFARRNGVPLHLVIHDDWAATTRLPSPFAQRVERQFQHAYRSAASRFCISPFMVEEFARRYGVVGSVLHPSRAMDAPPIASPPERVSQGVREIVFAFAGTVNSVGYSRLIRMLSDCLESQNGSLKIFGPMSRNQATRDGLNRQNIELCGVLNSTELIARLRTSADVLFVPMSFAAEDQANMMIGFPSKLADYTATGLPLLIVGPNYCSAVRWARANPGVAEIVDVADPQVLGAAVRRLAHDPGRRLRLAEQALLVGDEMFSHAAAQETFFSGLTKSSTVEVPTQSPPSQSRRNT